MNIRKKRGNRLSKLLLVVFVGILAFVGFRYLGPVDAKGLIAIAESRLNSFGSISTLNTSIKSTNSTTNTSFLSSEDLTQGVSYVLIDLQTDEILKSQNADLARAPASTLKLLTGLIAYESLKETDTIKVGSEVNVQGSKLGLSPGDEITVQNLLTALYVNSSNDAAAALAVKISGSIPEFAQKMNEYATTLGCQQSNFTNPHGMPDLEQYTTANDLSIIANHFIENKNLMEYVQKSSARVQWKDAQGIIRNAELQNTNLLLGVYPGDQGLKTGTTTQAGQCLVSYITRSDGDLLLVLLGSEQRYQDTISLLDEAWAEQRSKAALRNLSKDPRALILSPGIF